MSSKRTSRQDRRGSAPRRKAQIIIVVIVVVSLFAAWTMLAYSGAFDSALRQKTKKGRTVSPASLNSNSPSKEMIYAGSRLICTEEGAATSLSAPTNFKATADTIGQVGLTWDAVQGATKYEVSRGTTLSSFAPLTPQPTTTSYTDSVPFNSNSSTVVTYLYKIRALNDSGGTSAFSNLDLATAIIWTEDQIQQGVTTVKAQHLLELRDTVNAVRVAAEKSIVTNWQPGLVVQQPIKAVHITELRSYLDEALGAINPPTQPPYTDPNLTGGGITNIKKAHVEDLRRRVRHRSGA